MDPNGQERVPGLAADLLRSPPRARPQDLPPPLQPPSHRALQLQAPEQEEFERRRSPLTQGASARSTRRAAARVLRGSSMTELNLCTLHPSLWDRIGRSGLPLADPLLAARGHLVSSSTSPGRRGTQSDGLDWRPAGRAIRRGGQVSTDAQSPTDLREISDRSPNEPGELRELRGDGPRALQIPPGPSAAQSHCPRGPASSTAAAMFPNLRHNVA